MKLTPHHLLASRWSYWLLALLGLAVLALGLSEIPPLDRDEPRFAQASKQMLLSGDFGRIYFQDEPRLKKPIGIYWLQSLSAGLLGEPPHDDITLYRLPSLLGGVLSLLVLFVWARREAGPAIAWLAALILLASPLFQIESRLAKTDAVMLVTAIVTQMILCRAYQHPVGRGAALLFWLAQSLALLLKGPIVPLLSLLTILTLACCDRRIAWLRTLRPLAGLTLTAALTIPWVLWLIQQSDGAFVHEAISHDLLGKIFSGQDRGFLPAGYHTLLALIWFLPVAPAAIYAFHQAWRERAKPVPRLLLTSILPFWLCYELIATKLPHYVLPVLPAAALCIAYYAHRLPDTKGWRRIWQLHFFILLAFSTSLFAVAGYFLGFSWVAFGLVILSAGCFAAQWRLSGKLPLQALCCGCLGIILTNAMVFGSILPRSAPFWLTPQISAAYFTHRPCPLLSHLITNGYNEPSLVLTAGTHTQFANGAAYAARLMAQDECAVASIRDEQVAEFLSYGTLEGIGLKQVGSASGFNINGGGWQTHRLFVRTEYNPQSQFFPQMTP
jgi:4-amino-4-deoxy-L-arabinose transferase-like glycosyltransferase